MEYGNFCKERDVEYHVIKTQIAEVVFHIREESNPCSLCAKMRKGALNDAVKELGCNKVAYAHHKDDLLESMMMSFLFEREEFIHLHQLHTSTVPVLQSSGHFFSCMREM